MSYVPQPSSATLTSPPSARGDSSRPPDRLDNGPGAVLCPGQTNVFEWCWEHSTDLPDEDRAALLHHAFHAVAFADRTEADAIQFAGTDPWVNGRLIANGWLAVDAHAQAMWFPRYEASQDAGRWTR